VAGATTVGVVTAGAGAEAAADALGARLALVAGAASTTAATTSTGADSVFLLATRLVVLEGAAELIIPEDERLELILIRTLMPIENQFFSKNAFFFNKYLGIC